jgi:16S rRNA processing protein RimM
VALGRVSGAHGVKGWIKVQSFTEPRENIAQFDSWILEVHGSERVVEVEGSKPQGNSMLVKLAGVEDRDAAQALTGALVAVMRSALPPCASGEYYWTDLEGLSVRTVDGQALGTVDHLLATGSHDVLVLGGPAARMIPFVAGTIVKDVDLAARVIVVDWDESFWD